MVSSRGQRRDLCQHCGDFFFWFVFLRGRGCYEARPCFTQACLSNSVNAEFTVRMWSTTSSSWRKIESQSHKCRLNTAAVWPTRWNAGCSFFFFFFKSRKCFSLGYSADRSRKFDHSGYRDITKGRLPDLCVFVHTHWQVKSQDLVVRLRKIALFPTREQKHPDTI